VNRRIAEPSHLIPAAAGIGWRFPHHERVLRDRPPIAWLEVHAENYFGGGPARRCLEAVRRDYPVSLHGVGLSLGSAEGLDSSHLQRLAALVREIQPGAVSEHLAWSVVGGRYLADLLPLPLTEEALEVVSRHVLQMQEALQRQILIENPSTYVQFPHSTIDEWDFLTALAGRTGCSILCDVNNIVVSASTHGWSPVTYLNGLPPAVIGEIHLAGHTVERTAEGRALRIDDHGSRVGPEVWALFGAAVRRFGPVPTLIEWDTDIPALEVLLNEAARATKILSGSDRADSA